MKMKASIFILIVVGLAVGSCKEESFSGGQPKDSTRPGEVTSIEVTNVPGGAVLKYKLPPDEDLLYVKAQYALREGVNSEVRASLYNDTLLIQGFGDTAERRVKVIAVDRSGNESAPAEASINPLEAPVTTIGKTLNVMADFGGVHAYWQNPDKAEISVVILREDQNQEYVVLETYYSSMKTGEGATRGLDTIPLKIKAYVQDRWENKSEIKDYTITPIYETKLDRSKFRPVKLPGDAGDCCGWVISNMWDDQWNGGNGYSSPGGTGQWPHAVTMDLGITAQISRIRLFQRSEPYVFAEGNPRKFEVWGAQTLDPSGSWDSWTKLMDCTSIKPSGLPMGQNNNEDLDRSHNGEDFICSPENPKVRYIRIKVTRTWSGGDNMQISELQFFGDNR